MVKKTIFSTKSKEICPTCGEGTLAVCQSSQGVFKRCSNYPTCEYTEILRSVGQILQEVSGINCPECQSILVIKQQKFGLVISCSNYPVCCYQAKVNKSCNTEINCPSCHHGKLLQKHSRFGKVFYACDRYPSCRFVLNNLPVVGECPHCGYPLLMQKKLSKGSAIYCAASTCGKAVFVSE